jgi:hypothetical protein
MVNIPSFKTDEDLYEFGYQIVHKIQHLEDRIYRLEKIGKNQIIESIMDNNTSLFEENEIDDFYNSVIKSIQEQITELKTQLKALNKVRIDF